MEACRIVKIKEQPMLRNQAANWFHEKWNISKEAYLESIDECINGEESIPQWYVVMLKNDIIAGLGIIENDFHDRTDLTPNICAVYVEKKYRCQGIVGRLLEFVCDDMLEKNINTLYLITNHTSFYERYGWRYLCMVHPDGEEEQTRMYIHRKE